MLQPRWEKTASELKLENHMMKVRLSKFTNTTQLSTSQVTDIYTFFYRIQEVG
jgi:hypothetical protein